MIKYIFIVSSILIFVSLFVSNVIAQDLNISNLNTIDNEIFLGLVNGVEVYQFTHSIYDMNSVLINQNVCYTYGVSGISCN